MIQGEWIIDVALKNKDEKQLSIDKNLSSA